MKRPRQGMRWNAGYTIIETMIFLIVSSALIASATVLFDGRIQRTQFTQSVQELNQQLRDTIDQVSAGAYDTSSSFSCQPGGDGPFVDKNGTTAQGANTGCAFFGKVVYVNNKAPGIINRYAVAGLQGPDITQSNTDFSTAKPVLINGAEEGAANTNNPYQAAYGINVTGIKVLGANGQSISSFGLFLKSQASPAGDGGLSSGSSNVILVPVNNSAGVTDDGALAGLIHDPAHYLTNINPAGGIAVCLQSGTSNQVASIIIGVNGGSLATTVNIGQDMCS